jgi:hypothetical protein
VTVKCDRHYGTARPSFTSVLSQIANATNSSQSLSMPCNQPIARATNANPDSSPLSDMRIVRLHTAVCNKGGETMFAGIVVLISTFYSLFWCGHAHTPHKHNTRACFLANKRSLGKDGLLTTYPVLLDQTMAQGPSSSQTSFSESTSWENGQQYCFFAHCA